jgi:hypothetical protein
MPSASTKIATQSAAMLLGGVLLVAGLLKASSSFASLYHFGAVAIAASAGDVAMLSLATVEIALAITLAQRPFNVAAWRFAFLLFSLFAVVALAQASAGRQVCDCFGAVVLRPRYTAFFDILAACICAAALISLHRDSPVAAHYPTKPLLSSIVAFTLTFAALLYLRETRLGDMRYGIQPVVAELTVDQTDSSDAWLSGSALLASRGRQPVHVVGCVQNCGLKIKRPLPFDIESTTYARLPLLIRRPTDAEVGLVPLTLFVNVGGSLEKLTLPLLTPHLSE